MISTSFSGKAHFFYFVYLCPNELSLKETQARYLRSKVRDTTLFLLRYVGEGRPATLLCVRTTVVAITGTLRTGDVSSRDRYRTGAFLSASENLSTQTPAEKSRDVTSGDLPAFLYIAK